MADNVTADPGSGGATFRMLQEQTTLLQWPASIVAYVTGGSADAWTLQEVDATHGLPVAVVGTVPVSLASVPSHAVTNAGTFLVQVDALPSGLATSVKQDTGNTSLASIDGKITAVNTGAVVLAAGSAVIGHVILDSGTITTVSTITAVSDAQAQGKAAHDAAASGNPVLMGVFASRARPAAVSADGDVAHATGDRYARLQTVGVDLTALALQVTASGDTDLVAAPLAGSRLKLLRVEASNSHASTAVVVGLKSASVNSGAVFGKKHLPAAGGMAVWTFPGGHLMCGDAEKLAANLSTTGQVEVTAYYETIAT